jgi:Zn-dependent protease
MAPPFDRRDAGPSPGAPGSPLPSPHPGTVYPPPAADHPYPAYLPPGWGGGQPPAVQGPDQGPTGQGPNQRSNGRAQRRGGALGGLAAAVVAFAKWGLVLFKFGNFGLTALSMLVALVIYAQIFGWAFGLGIVLLILIHEMGHYLFSTMEGVPVSAPVFLGPFGAFTTHRGLGTDRRVEAVIAIGGPLFGFLATLALYLWALSQPVVTHDVALVFALSYVGFLLTLFNLIPFSPLDGGRVAGAVSKWTNVAGLLIFGAVLLSQVAGLTYFNPFLLLIFIVGVYSVWGRFRAARLGAEPPPLPARTRLWIGTAYVVLVVMSALLMSLAHGALVAGGYVSIS